jgi:phosphoenolpyruvate carboxylase
VKRQDIQFPARHAALRDDVHALGALVGEILKEQGGDSLFDLVEQDRMAAIACQSGTAGGMADLAVRVRGRAPELARDLVRSFSMWFQAVNLAEKVHRIRRRREYFLADSARPQPGGVEDALAQLKQRGLSLQDVLGLLGRLRIEPVFTAHPTESTRRTILRKQQQVAELLFDRLNPTLSPNELRSIWGRVRQELTTWWQTEDHPRERLTVADEREHVVFYLAEVLYRMLPAFYEEIAQALAKLYSVPAESFEVPLLIRFGTWVGGDMDGNPDVHAKAIRETLARAQQVIVNAYFNECQQIAQKLSQSASRAGISVALQQRMDQYTTLIPAARSLAPARHDRMPYRVFFGQVAERLRLTYESRSSGYESPAQLQRDLQIALDSLAANRGWNAGYYAVRRLHQRVSTFGFHLATLDVRQHTDVHHRVIAQGLEDPQWLARSAAERHELLTDAIVRDLGPKVELDALGKRSLAVFETLLQCRRRHGVEAVGYYVVSGVRDADDILAPLLLARWAEAYEQSSKDVPVDIAPLFESVSSLERCGAIMRELLHDRVYEEHLRRRGSRQCVLVGYSDSSKEAGLCASRVAVYAAQRGLAHTLRDAHEQHVIFLGRGGSIARGGGRIDALVRAMPSEAVNGVLRLTEQGEVINQNYGLRPIAMRTLERAFHALALATDRSAGAPAPPERPQWVAMTQQLAVASRERYRRVVWGDPEFFAYFSAATPIDVIERMQIGSRPATRPDRSGLDGLRAVPWVFAWTQSRLMLPGWFGAGAGLRAARESHGDTVLAEAYMAWPFFRSLIDDVEAMLARADLDVAAAYDELAAQPLRRFFAEARGEFELCRDQVLTVKGSQNLLDTDPTLQRAIALRNPYVYPMNFMQVDLLRRWRAANRDDRMLFEALLASISGIAQGLQSTG